MNTSKSFKRNVQDLIPFDTAMCKIAFMRHYETWNIYQASTCISGRACDLCFAGLMCELLWSDPQPMPGRAESKRGVGTMFGPDITSKFLQRNNLEYIIRSHEVKPEGYEVMHDGKCITVFSAPNYWWVV